MIKNSIFSIIKVTVFIVAVSLFSSVFAQNSKFTIVIDAGHGGHDPGAIGKITREKDINLAVALQLGELIATNYNNVKVVFTRTSDKYLTLQERAAIVNTNHADLFISIHTNAAKSTAATGTESFTLGLAKSKGNLDVAMRENAVMLLEDDYKSKYKGFDPTSVDSYIMFEFMQDKYIDRSVSIASDIQNHFKNYAGRSDRGVRQAGFWVLYQSACPSVLVEVGFISNPAEEKYLASGGGQKQIAESIYKAFVGFKYEHDKKSGKSSKKSFNETESIKIEEVGRNDKAADGVEAPLKSVVANTKDAVVPVSEIAKPTIEKSSKSTKVDKKNKQENENITLNKETENKKVESKQVESKQVDNKQTATKQAESKKTENLPVESKIENKQTAGKPTEKISTDNKKSDIKSVTKNEVKSEKIAKDTDIIADSFSKVKPKVGNETIAQSKLNKETEDAETEEVKTESKSTVKVDDNVTVDIQIVKPNPVIPKQKPISAEKKQYVDLRAYDAATVQPVYKVQLFSISRKLKTNAAEFRGIRNADFYIENGMYKYTIGSDTKYDVISKLRKEMLSVFPDAFTIAFLGKTKIPINEAIKLSNKNK